MLRAAMRPFALLVLAALSASPAAADLDPSRPDTWQIPHPDLYAVAARGELVWAVGYWGTVLRSTDSGATWTALETRTRETLFDVSFASDRSGWAVGENGWCSAPSTRA